MFLKGLNITGTKISFCVFCRLQIDQKQNIHLDLFSTIRPGLTMVGVTSLLCTPLLSLTLRFIITSNN